jgi:hypothetical protein
VSTDEPPEATLVGFAVIVAVGAAGGGVVTFGFVPPQAVRITATAESMTCAKTFFFI